MGLGDFLFLLIFRSLFVKKKEKFWQDNLYVWAAVHDFSHLRMSYCNALSLLSFLLLVKTLEKINVFFFLKAKYSKPLNFGITICLAEV